MAFTNDETFTDDYRKTGPDSTAQFERAGRPNNPTEHASSENLAAATDEDEDEVEEDDLDEDDDLDDEEDLGDDDAADEEEDDDLEDEDDLEEDDEEEEEDEDDGDEIQ